MKAKVFYRWIRKNAKQLEPETYTAYYPEIVEVPVPGGGKPLQLRKKMPEEMPVNHYRRAKRAWQRGGIQEMDLYFRVRGFKIMPTNTRTR
jgi:hypothetical protein